MKDRKYPTWVTEQEQCLWCFHMIDLTHIRVNDAGDGVEMVYVCNNPKCEHQRVLSGPHKMVMVQYGLAAVETFRRKMSESPAEHAKMKADEIAF